MDDHKTLDDMWWQPAKEDLPSITLFYDSDKRLTVAVLSRAADPLTVYFQCRVQQGTAYARSALYYELEGFVRENHNQLRKVTACRFVLTVALGSLEASDEAQQQELLEEQQQQVEVCEPFDRLEEVLEIARLHRMSDDLDVLSVYSMRLASKSLGKVAAKIARQQLERATIVVQPLVDGRTLGGLSHFIRPSPAPLRRTNDAEYCERPSLELVHFRDGSFVPRGESAFSWDCQEVTLGTMDHWWGDIVQRDYEGQRLEVGWKTGTNVVPLSSIRLEANPRVGENELQTSLVRVRLDVKHSDLQEVDHVTMAYRGKAILQSVQLGFLCLVRAHARERLTAMREHHREVLETRPLLPQERTYMKLVEDLATC